MLDVVTLGEAMVLLVPDRSGLLRYANRFERSVAGAESNLAVGLARLRHRVGWISRLGADEFGAYVNSFIRGEGIDVSQVARDETAPTAVFFKERRRKGATRVYYYRSGSAASRMSPDDLDPAYLQQAKYLHLTGITPALSSSCRDVVQEAVDIASTANVVVSFDPNLRLKLWSLREARDVLLGIIKKVQLVLTSREEAEQLTGRDDPEKAGRALLELGPERVVVKLGADGALALSEDRAVREPAIDVEEVEAVGAGDAFNAGFLSGQLRGWDVRKSLRLGNVMGGLAVTVPGDVEGVPTWKEVQPFFGGERSVAR